MTKKTRGQKFKTAATTFSIALGIGFVMQYGDAMASRWGEDRPVSGPSSLNGVADDMLVPVTASVALPQTLETPAQSAPEVRIASSAIVPMDIETPSFSALTVPSVDAVPTIAAEPLVVVAAGQTPDIAIDAMPAPITAAPVCDQSLTATPSGFAMLTLAYAAPCDANATVTVIHEDMMFETIADANGAFELDIPALTQDALFGVESTTGVTVFATADVPEIAMYDRVVLQWQGRSDVQLHALEFGATYGGEGHIWAASAGDRLNAATGESGFLTRLGEGTAATGFFADVYTFPTGLSAMDGQVSLSVEAEVTAMNCDRAVQAQTMQVNASDQPTIQSLTMTMPGCDAIGEFLVLNNMFEDLTLASR